MAKWKIRINGTTELDHTSSSNHATSVADEFCRYVRDGDGDERELRLFWENIATLEVVKVSD